MRDANKTRTQRRMERRHAVILLVLLLVASLASFVVGILVGRQGGDSDQAAKQQIEEVLIGQEAPAPLQQPVPERPVVEGAEAGVPADLTQELEPMAELTFYDDLSKEPKAPAEPLGSGINVAPAVKVEPPIALPDKPVVVVQTPAVKTPAVKEQAAKAAEPIVIAATSTAMPKPAAAGTHAVQIGSFNASKDALALKDKMVASGYPAYMVEADLGEKGLWYRVKIGPYAGASTAKVAQEALLKKEQVKGFVTRK